MNTRKESMSTNDHLVRAREYIAKGDEFYAKAADEIMAWLADDESRSQAQAAREMGVSPMTVSRAIRARKSGTSIDWESGSNKRDDVAAKVLANPEQRRQVIASLPPEQIEAVIEDAHGVAMERLHAKQAEHDAAPRKPTVGDLMGDDPFDPSESWADVHIIRVQSKAHALAFQVAKWGLVLGSMTEEEAYEGVQEAERNIAGVRVALQERIRDRHHAEQAEV